MMECESTSATAATTTGNNNDNKMLTRREEIDSGIPWVEKYRPKRYVHGYSYNPLVSLLFHRKERIFMQHSIWKIEWMNEKNLTVALYLM